MIRSFGLPLLACLFHSIAMARTSPLSIGDRMPDITIEHILNAPFPKIQLSAYLHKPVVLEFFGTWCGSCRKALPHFDSLQEQFGERVQFIAVGYEPEATVKDFIQQQHYLQKSRMLVTATDTLLHGLFPHRTLPHIVCLDAEHRIIAITNGQYVTDSVIRQLLAGTSINLPVKDDFAHKHLGLDNAEKKQAVIVEGLLTQAVSNRPRNNGTESPKNSSSTKYWWYNIPLMELLQLCSGMPYANRIIGADSNQLTTAYCIELTVPANTSKQSVLEYLKQQMELGLQLRITRQLRRLPCLVLRLGNDRDSSKLISKGGKPFTNLHLPNRTTTVLTNKPLLLLIRALNTATPGMALPKPCIDATGIQGPVDLLLNLTNLHDTGTIKKALLPYSLYLTEEESEIEVLVIEKAISNK